VNAEYYLIGGFLGAGKILREAVIEALAGAGLTRCDTFRPVPHSRYAAEVTGQ